MIGLHVVRINVKLRSGVGFSFIMQDNILADLRRIDLLRIFRNDNLAIKNSATGTSQNRPGVLAAQARALREWFRGFVSAHKGRPLKPRVLDELEPLNRVLARDEEFGQIIARDNSRKAKALRAEQGEEEPSSELEWSQQRRWRSPDSLLLPIAKAMADLVCDVDFSHVKACEGHNCTLLFVDRTRGHARRWCSMAVCGNRAKQAAHRVRQLRR